MKKALLLILLVPFIGLSQNATVSPSELLVRYEGTRIGWSAPTGVPMYYYNNTTGTMTTPADFSATYLTGQGINFNSFEQYTGFSGSDWPSANQTNYGKYYQIKVTAAAGKKIEVKNFKFRYTNYATAFKIVYQKSTGSAEPSDDSFSSNGSVLVTNTTAQNNYNQDLAYAFPSGYFVQPGETLYIRIYGYSVPNNNNKWFLVHGNQNYNEAPNSGSTGPAIYGVVSSAAGVTASGDTATVTETQSVNIPVITNDSAIGTTISAVSLGTLPAGSSATVGTDKSITFTAPQLTTTTAQVLNFSYTITGADNSTSTANVAVTVTPFASPTVTNYTKTTGVSVPVSVSVLDGATAGSGTISASGVSIVSATNGTATVNATTGAVTYTPNSGTAGQTGVVTYKITNSNQKATTGTITVTIQAVVAPTATTDSYTIAKNTATELNVMSNDNIGSGSFSNIVVFSQPAHGTATVTSTNKITYTPTTGYTGSDSFTYKLTNTYNATSAAATVTLNVVTPSTSGALCGTYTVGVGGNFTTLTAAVNHLNTYGVQCNVTFSLINNAATGSVNTEYSIANGETFPLTINSFTNPNNYTVTFKPATGKNPVINAKNPNNWTAIPALFKINGADNIIIDGSNVANGNTRNLMLKNSDEIESAHRSIVWVASNGTDPAQNITVKNAVIYMVKKNGTYAYATGVYSGSNSEFNVPEGNNNDPDTIGILSNTATANNSGLTVTNNDFINVKQGVYVNGSSSSIITNVSVTGNDLGAENNTETIIDPAHFNNVNGFVFSENLIYNLYRDNSGGSLPSSGIYITGNSSNGTITKNTFKDLYKTLDEGHYFAAIVLSSTNTSNSILVANNFISNVSGYAAGSVLMNGHGILIVRGGGYKIYHNTIRLSTNQYNNATSGLSAALMVNYGVTHLDVRNNIFVNNQTVGFRTAIALKTSAAVTATQSETNAFFDYLDNNDYYSADRTAFAGNNPDSRTYENTGFIALFSSFKSLTGKDASSKNVNPTFVSATDLHVNAYDTQNDGFANAGSNASVIATAVSKDIDGQVRSTTTPDMGADEFGVATMPTPGNNAGIYCDSSTTFTGYVNGVEQWSNGAPSSTKDVIFNADYTQTGGTFNACSVYVLAGKSVNFTNNATATVQHTVNIADTGALTFESGSNLIQVADEQNSGIATVKRKGGLLKRLDYTLWSSPVTDNRTTGYWSLLNFSPLTSTYPSRFYWYDTANDYYATITSPSTTKFTLGQSVLVRMPNNMPDVLNYNSGQARFQFEGIFKGTINNGTIRVPLNFSNAGFNGTGNPYPSPIDINAFIQENAVNRSVIDPTVWIWRKTNNENTSSYATVTMAGYAANQQGNDAANTFVTDPNGILNTGQGFLVKALAANKELVFENNMRSSTQTTTFFKTQQDGPQAVQNGKVWLNLKGGENFSQALIDYRSETSTGYDNGYEGLALIGGNLSIYSLLATDTENVKYTIQSRGDFDDTDVIPMGYIAAAAGTYEFEIDHAEGLFSEGQEVYIKDNMLGTINSLNNGNYSFTTDAGTFESRFEVVYKAQGQLGTDVPAVEAKDVIVYNNNQQISITSTEEISAVTVYDMLGRVLFTQNEIGNTEFSTAQLTIAQQVVIVNVTLSNNQTVSKKIMMN
jgi:trimeric autotransporter adhesin